MRSSRADRGGRRRRVSALGAVRCLVLAIWWCSAGLALAVDPPQPYLKEPSYPLCPHLLGGSESFRDRLAAAGVTVLADNTSFLVGNAHGGFREAFDYAGHGESAKAPLARYTIPNTLGDVLDCMAALRVPRAVVIGTSLGGLLGMVLSVLRPGALAGLVLNDSGPRIDAGGLSGAREVIGSDPRLGSIEECNAYLRRLLP